MRRILIISILILAGCTSVNQGIDQSSKLSKEFVHRTDRLVIFGFQRCKEVESINTEQLGNSFLSWFEKYGSVNMKMNPGRYHEDKEPPSRTEKLDGVVVHFWDEPKQEGFEALGESDLQRCQNYLRKLDKGDFNLTTVNSNQTL